jgi:hypothetical protein
VPMVTIRLFLFIKVDTLRHYKKTNSKLRCGIKMCVTPGRTLTCPGLYCFSNIGAEFQEKVIFILETHKVKSVAHHRHLVL